MVIKPLQIKLDIAKKNDCVYLVSKQNDTARAVEIQLLNNGEKIILPQSANVTLNVKKPDGTFAKLSCTINPDGTATGKFTNQALAAPGDAVFDVIALYTENGEQRQISALNAHLHVQAAAIPEDVIVSSDEFKALVDALLAVQNYKTSAPKGITYDSLNDRLNAAEADTLQLQIHAAKTDAELAALRAAQAQMSTDTRIDLPGTGKVTQVPKNAAVMGVGGTIKGMMLQNLFEEYKLRGADLIGWVNDGTSSTISISNNVVTVTGTGNSATVGAAYWGKIKTIQNNKYLVRFKAMATNSDCQQIRVQVGGNTKDVITTPLATGTWYEGSTIINSPTTNVAQIVFYFVYADAATASGKSVQIKECSAINLTAWGLDTKSTVDMLMISPNVFSGTQSVTPMRLRSVNKNLFDVSASDNWEIGTLSNTIGDVLTKTSSTTILRYKHWKKIPLKPNTQYIFTSSTFATYSVGWRLIDEDNIIVALKSAGTSNYTFTSPSFVSYLVPVIVRVDSAAVSLSDVLKVSAQLEEGMSSSSIESHKATACYIEPRPMRRLPNNVCDMVDLTTGKRTINVKEYALQESDITGYNEGTNAAQVVIKKQADSYALSSNTYNNGHSILEGYGYRAAYAGLFDYTQNIGYLLSDTAPTAYVLVVAKGTYANVAAARAALAGKKLYYQLATPITENNVVSGSLISYPKGLIICEPVIADAGIYNNGISVLRTAYPIQSLETLCKINIDGTQTPLDVSAATITDAGTKITHPALSNGDIVAFTYFTASSGIIGENVFNYVNANGLTQDSVTGKYYKKVTTLANLVETTTWQEVV